MPHHLRALSATVLAAAIASGSVLAADAAPRSADPDPAAQVQSMLDRVLGPGSSIVEIAMTVRSGAATSTSVRWGAALPASVAGTRVRSGSSSFAAVTRTDVIDRTATSTVTPAGAVLRQTVSVAVDRRALGSTSVGRLRRLVAAAVGLLPARGDRLSVVAVAFPGAGPAAAPASSWTAALPGLAVPAIEGAGGLLGVLILIAAARRARRRPDEGLRRS